MSLPSIRHAALRSAPLLAALWFAASAAHAQSANETRLRDALRDTASRLRTAEAALAQQQAATAAAERERDELKGRAAKPAPAADGAQLAALQQRLGQASASAEQARGEALKWRSAQEQAAHSAQQKERERAELAKRLDAAQARAADCAAGSEALYQAGRELAQLYRDPAYAKGKRVTLLGFGQVERENRARELENKLEDERAKTAQCGAGDAAARTAGTMSND
ncbi:hypothetical protein [Lysobacter enzymogenes]|uniref:hypothetical protein n=1 Tax=Lysobacter enzymogenes TaxID=69 RepID=UPI001AFA3350|nr:hypothetical protein [Lysobacter enzymogenes]QQP99184.1 hypothetical protein JHW41_13690 [Lysobacter enzymogenes]